jgi:hypothetical protein
MRSVRHQLPHLGSAIPLMLAQVKLFASLDFTAVWRPRAVPVISCAAHFAFPGGSSRNFATSKPSARNTSARI